MIRGALLALVVLPAGTALWLVVWNFGFVASAVSALVAVGAVLLYRRGSGGPISILGALIASLITFVTLAVAFFSGIVTDALPSISESTGRTWAHLIMSEGFWAFFGEALPSAMSDYASTLVMSIALGVIGSFTVLRNAFHSARTKGATGGPDAVDAAADADTPSAEPGVPRDAA